MSVSRPEDRFARLAAAVQLEITRVERIAEEARSAVGQFATAPPSALELRGLGAVVHDFYTGLERAFEKVAVELDGGAPGGSSWHRDLLESMTLDIADRRPAVLSADLGRDLDEMLRFRHLFRNLYGFELQWDRLRPLLERVPPLWARVRKDVDAFVDFLLEASRTD